MQSAFDMDRQADLLLFLAFRSRCEVLSLGNGARHRGSLRNFGVLQRCVWPFPAYVPGIVVSKYLAGKSGVRRKGIVEGCWCTDY